MLSLTFTDTVFFVFSVKDTVVAYMDRKQVEVTPDVEDCFPDTILMSQVVEAWKYAVRARHEWMM